VGERLVRPSWAAQSEGRQNKYFEKKILGFLRSKIVKLLSQIRGNSMNIIDFFTVYTSCLMLWAAIVIACPGRQNASLRHCL
jgi:hypothetical protein